MIIMGLEVLSLYFVKIS